MVGKIAMIRRLMENYPEAGAGNCLKCAAFNYSKLNFIFFDEEGKEPEKALPVSKKMLSEGFDRLLELIKEGKYFNCGQVPNLLSDAYQEDAQDSDALVQCALYGEIIYG
jgi:hypothetical protein